MFIQIIFQHGNFFKFTRSLERFTRSCLLLSFSERQKQKQNQTNKSLDPPISVLLYIVRNLKSCNLKIPFP